MTQKYKILIVPAISFLVILFLFIFLIQFLFSRISPLNQRIADSRVQQSQLSSKLTSLQQLDQATLDLTDNAYIAMPDRNPAALIVFQLRKVAAENQVAINNLSISEAGVEAALTSQALIDFDAEGSITNIMNMLDAIKRVAPMVNVDRLKINRVSAEQVNANIALYTYWAPFPETLPSINEGGFSFTDEELNTLTQISEFDLPEFNTGQPTTEEARPNPFSIDN